MSRSIGDPSLKESGVIAEPDILSREISEKVSVPSAAWLPAHWSPVFACLSMGCLVLMPTLSLW